MTATAQQIDTAAARRSLRDQIARMERELALTLASTYPHVTAGGGPIAHGGPRLLDLRQLEETRDALVARVSDVQQRAAEQRAAQAQARARLEAMRADPASYKGETITAVELGLPGCAVYTVRQRVLTGWWRVKVSSGCP